MIKIMTVVHGRLQNLQTNEDTFDITPLKLSWREPIQVV